MYKRQLPEDDLNWAEDWAWVAIQVVAKNLWEFRNLWQETAHGFAEDTGLQHGRWLLWGAIDHAQWASHIIPNTALTSDWGSGIRAGGDWAKDWLEGEGGRRLVGNLLALSLPGFVIKKTPTLAKIGIKAGTTATAGFGLSKASGYSPETVINEALEQLLQRTERDGIMGAAEEALASNELANEQGVDAQDILIEEVAWQSHIEAFIGGCLLYTSPSPRD